MNAESLGSKIVVVSPSRFFLVTSIQLLRNMCDLRSASSDNQQYNTICMMPLTQRFQAQGTIR